MNPDVEVDAPALCAAAGDTAELAAQVSSDAQDAPAAVTVPGWATADAAGEATASARRQAASIAADIAQAADQIIAAVVDYEAADQRAASRVRAGEDVAKPAAARGPRRRPRNALGPFIEDNPR